jgi:hypothetical protein
VLTRLERIARERSVDFAQTRQEVTEQNPSGLGLWSMIEKLKRLTITSPLVDPAATQPREILQWLGENFWPRWAAWCVAPVEPPWERLKLGRILFEYNAIVYPELRGREEDGQREGVSLLKELRSHPPDGLLAEHVWYDAGSPKDEDAPEERRALRQWLRDCRAEYARECAGGIFVRFLEGEARNLDFSHPPERHVLAEFTLPPGWNRHADTPHDIALAVLAERHEVDTTKIKEWLAAARTWEVWHGYSRWLGANRPALQELADHLGVEIMLAQVDE